MARRVRRFFSWLLVLILCALFFALPCSAEHLDVIRQINTEEKKIALTFDDGPSRQNLEEILAVLDEYHAKGTFFVLGCKAEELPEQIKLIADAGHEIANHTYSHAYISKLSEKNLQEEVKKTEDILQKITGVRPRLFRPPGGYISSASLAVTKEMGYENVMWSLDTRDWSFPSPDKVISCVKKSAKSGDIILFHDLENKKLPTAQILRGILPYLIEEGYSFVTVTELVDCKAE